MKYFIPTFLVLILFICQIKAQPNMEAQTSRGGLEIRGITLMDMRSINTLESITKQLATTRSKQINTHQGQIVFEELLTRKERKKTQKIDQLNLWGENFTFLYDSNLQFNIEGTLNKSTIRKYWDQLADTKHDIILKQLNFLASYLRLNDWGYCMMVHKLAENLYPDGKNEQKIFESFILGKAGYESRLSYDKNRIYLLMTSKQRIYGSRSKKIRSGSILRKFYVIDIGEGVPDATQAISLDLKDIPYPAPSNKADGIDFKMTETPNFILEPSLHEYSFQYKGNQYKLKAILNQHLLDYYSSVPFVGAGINFNSPLSKSATHTLIPQLKEIVKDMSEQEAINLLLRFVQKSFPYERDSTNFGKETYLVPEQTLASKASDCEDRCFLFSYLIKEILDLEAIGLQYKGHMAVGVRLKNDVPATYIPYNNVKYYICDPTMPGANLGQTLPKHSKEKAKLIFSD